MTRGNPYDDRYAAEEYYWSKTPSAMCERVLEVMRPEPGRSLKLLDLGCGEGRNAVYFAQHGFEVFALDSSLPGLGKAERYAAEVGVSLHRVHADMTTYRLDDVYDVVFSTGALHYLPPEVRQERFADYKVHTAPGGLHAMSVLVRKPFIPAAPDAEPTAHPYGSGELLGYYWDWEVLYCTEEVFDCRSSGVPHRHAVNRVIARPAPAVGSAPVEGRSAGAP